MMLLIGVVAIGCEKPMQASQSSIQGDLGADMMADDNQNKILTFGLISGVIMSICARAAGRLVGPIHQDGIFGMSLDVLLQILGPLERFAAKFAPMRF